MKLDDLNLTEDDLQAAEQLIRLLCNDESPCRLRNKVISLLDGAGYRGTESALVETTKEERPLSEADKILFDRLVKVTRKLFLIKPYKVITKSFSISIVDQLDSSRVHGIIYLGDERLPHLACYDAECELDMEEIFRTITKRFNHIIYLN